MGVLFSKKQSAFVNLPPPNRPEPNPLRGQEADRLLENAERLDGYRAGCSHHPLNRKSRSDQTYAGALDFSKQAILPAKKPWPNGQVLWMDDTADNGLPHTRPPNLICIPINFPSSALEMTLLHERVHVHQRIHMSLWNKFFQKHWNFTPYLKALPDALEAMRRFNPDVYYANLYVWKNTWVPFAVFNETQDPNLLNSSTIWFHVNQKVILREAPEGWREFFGSLPSDEHPLEISAYYISDPRFQDVPAAKVLIKEAANFPSSEIV